MSSKISFFGYYNLSPANKIGELLYLNVNKEYVRGSLFEPANIMIKNLNGNAQQIEQTNAWNWQQGSMLQWLGPDFDKIIYNDFDGDKYISKIINRNGELIKLINKPIYSVSKSGKYALTLSYERLAKFRPDYGYFNHSTDQLLPESGDGIWKINLETGDYQLIISLEQLKSLHYVSTMQGANHKVNHIEINPSSDRFMFLHRWIGPQGRYMRLITSTPDGNELFILNGDLMTSHCCWIDNETILAFCTVDGLGTEYFAFKDLSFNRKLFSAKLPSKDGHPSVSPDGQWLITDTYPDKARMSYLYLYNLKNNKVSKIGRFYQPLRYKKEMRIDLHPKWSITNKSVLFESGHAGTRKLYSLELNNYVK